MPSEKSRPRFERRARLCHWRAGTPRKRPGVSRHDTPTVRRSAPASLGALLPRGCGEEEIESEMNVKPGSKRSDGQFAKRPPGRRSVVLSTRSKISILPTDDGRGMYRRCREREMRAMRNAPAAEHDAAASLTQVEAEFRRQPELPRRVNNLRRIEMIAVTGCSPMQHNAASTRSIPS
jgi:hypothetical protein